MELYIPYYGLLDWFEIGTLAPGLVEAPASPLNPRMQGTWNGHMSLLIKEFGGERGTRDLPLLKRLMSQTNPGAARCRTLNC
jgi:hypothetical protein